MAQPIQTGHGVTISFTGFTGYLISLDGAELTREALDASYMGTVDYRDKVPGDLVDPGQSTLEFFYDTDEQPPITGAAATATITLPDGATIARSGFFTSFKEPQWQTDTLQRATGVITWSGATTYTDAV